MKYDQVKDTLVNLTENQARFLKPIFLQGTASSGASGLRGHGLGRVAGSTKAKGVVTEMGRKDRQTKWTLTPEWESNWNKYRQEIINILDKVAQE